MENGIKLNELSIYDIICIADDMRRIAAIAEKEARRATREWLCVRMQGFSNAESALRHLGITEDDLMGMLLEAGRKIEEDKKTLEITVKAV